MLVVEKLKESVSQDTCMLSDAVREISSTMLPLLYRANMFPDWETVGLSHKETSKSLSELIVQSPDEEMKSVLLTVCIHL